MLFIVEKKVGFMAVVAVIAAFSFIHVATTAFAQEDFAPEGDTYVIKEPAAWTRPKGEIAVSTGFTPWVVRGEIAILDYVLLGVAYGGTDVLGYGEPDFNPYPAFQIKFRITNGGAVIPALSVGYDDMGQGRYLDGVNPYQSKNESRDARERRIINYNRYVIKAKGFYAVASQEYGLFGALGFHFGMNYSVREAKDDDTLDFFAAVEKSLGPRVMIMATYDVGFNDDNDNALGQGRGFLNTGIRWHVSDDFDIDFYVTNLFNNQEKRLGDEGKYTRMFYITYKWFL
jgi:hypothetical protein